MNADSLRVAHHESVHLVAAAHYGWPIRGVTRGRGSHSVSHLTPPTDDLRARAIEAGVVLLAPFLEDAAGCEGDLHALDRLTRNGTPLSKIWLTASHLVAEPKFRRRVRLLEAALCERPVMTGAEVLTLIEGER